MHVSSMACSLACSSRRSLPKTFMLESQISRPRSFSRQDVFDVIQYHKGVCTQKSLGVSRGRDVAIPSISSTHGPRDEIESMYFCESCRFDAVQIDLHQQQPTKRNEATECTSDNFAGASGSGLNSMGRRGMDGR